MMKCQHPKPQYKKCSPQPPNLKHKSQWHFMHWRFVRGIQTGCRAVCMDNQGTPPLRFCTMRIPMQLPIAACANLATNIHPSKPDLKTKCWNIKIFWAISNKLLRFLNLKNAMLYHEILEKRYIQECRDRKKNSYIGNLLTGWLEISGMINHTTLLRDLALLHTNKVGR